MVRSPITPGRHSPVPNPEEGPMTTSCPCVSQDHLPEATIQESSFCRVRQQTPALGLGQGGLAPPASKGRVELWGPRSTDWWAATNHEDLAAWKGQPWGHTDSRCPGLWPLNLNLRCLSRAPCFIPLLAWVPLAWVPQAWVLLAWVPQAGAWCLRAAPFLDRLWLSPAHAVHCQAKPALGGRCPGGVADMQVASGSAEAEQERAQGPSSRHACSLPGSRPGPSLWAWAPAGNHGEDACHSRGVKCPPRPWSPGRPPGRWWSCGWGLQVTGGAPGGDCGACPFLSLPIPRL